MSRVVQLILCNKMHRLRAPSSSIIKRDYHVLFNIHDEYTACYNYNAGRQQLEHSKEARVINTNVTKPTFSYTRLYICIKFTS